MPEVPSNMQENLTHMELETNPPRGSSMASASQANPNTYPSQDSAAGSNQQGSMPAINIGSEGTNAAVYQYAIRESQNFGSRSQPESPKFSPFPKLRDPGPNIPPSDEEKEEVLDRTRTLILKSPDPEVQLAWAHDALSWVEIANQSYLKQQTNGEPPRSVTPKIEHQLKTEGMGIVNFLASQGHPRADFMKSMWLEFGKFGFRPDKKEAFLGYKRAADKGYARAEYRIGMQFESSNNSAKAVEHYQAGVTAGDAAASYRLGMMILLGQHGMPQDYQHGTDLIRYSADEADENAPQGAYVYGMLLSRDLPNITVPEQVLPFDLNGSKHYIEKAAYLGFAKAQLKMAQAYELCQLGCEFEPALSLHYNALASHQGEAEADMAISKWFLCGYEGVFEKNEELAFIYAKRAAQGKMATAEFALGYFYEIGVWVPVDLEEAEVWYKRASDHGNSDALGRINSIKHHKPLGKQDHQGALTKIKSQYGSQRGARPDRLKQRGAPMPDLAETDLADQRTSSLPLGPSSQYQRQGNGGLPIRPISAAPYPESPMGGPAAGLPRRPVSVAPYPEHDMAGHPSDQGYGPPGQGLRPTSRSGPNADRPSSAFGIRPLAHSATDTALQGSRQSDGRPASSMGNMPMHGGMPAARGGYPQGPGSARNSGAPHWAAAQVADFGRQGSMDQGPPPPRSLPKPAATMNSPQYHPQLSKQGYVGPPEAGRLQGPQGGRGAPAEARRDTSGGYTRPERGSSMLPASNAPQQNTNPNARASSRPPPQNPQHAQTMPNTMSSQGPGSGTATPPSSQAPKRTGPATFEEMGIPAKKDDNECVRIRVICL